jgi:hypothetical protein
MQNLDVDAIMQQLSSMKDDDLQELNNAVKRLKIAVTSELRRRRGKEGAGVLSVKGQTYTF